MRYSLLFAPILALAVPSISIPGHAQKVTHPQASIVDVAARQAALKTSADPLLREAIKGLHSCVDSPVVPAPTGVMDIPHHYLSGSNGPVNPAEAVATRAYQEFERRITSGMNEYLATGSHKEAACALDQLDVWAKGGALLNYTRKDSPQAWYQVEWTLSAAGITESVLVNDGALDGAEQKRVIGWLDQASHKDISFEQPNDTNNNHHYWRALQAVAIGIVASDDVLYRFGIQAYVDAGGEIDARGAFPKEMARHENAIHYQGFALQPLVLIAEFVTRQGIPLYDFKANGRSLRDAIVFFGQAVDDPSVVKPYTADLQATGFGAGDFSEFVFYAARFGNAGLPPAIQNALKKPTTATRLGGCTTLMAGLMAGPGKM